MAAGQSLLLTKIFFLLRLGNVFCGVNYVMYQQLYMSDMQCGKYITSHLMLDHVYTVKSRIECAAHCLRTLDCEVIMFDSEIRQGRKGVCTLVAESSDSSPYIMEDNSTFCLMKKSSQILSAEAMISSTTELTPTNAITTTIAPLTTTEAQGTTTEAPLPVTDSSTTSTTTPTTTTTTTTTTMTTSSYAATIIDMIDNVNNMCNSNSQHDIAIVTTNGVHLYDNADFLTTGACRNMTIEELFQGYTSLPSVTEWRALLTYTNTYFDLITDGDVYRWQKDSQRIVRVAEYPKSKFDYIRSSVYYTPTNIFSGAQWAIYMGTGAQALFFYDSSTIYYHRNQPPNEGSFPISDTSPMDSNSKPLNLWFNLPSNVIALTGQENTNRVLVLDSDLNVYFYEWTGSDDFNTDPPTLSLRGKLRL